MSSHELERWYDVSMLRVVASMAAFCYERHFGAIHRTRSRERSR
jgi:hypothetical protein